MLKTEQIVNLWSAHVRKTLLLYGLAHLFAIVALTPIMKFSICVNEAKFVLYKLKIPLAFVTGDKARPI